MVVRKKNEMQSYDMECFVQSGECDLVVKENTMK